MIATADLQGRELISKKAVEPPRLLGEMLPLRIVEDVLPTVGDIDPQMIGVLLAGDFYTVPALDRRGGSGDVSAVWQAFGDTFGWVAGVAGNHDLYAGDAIRPKRLPRGMHFLDGDTVNVGNFMIAGIGGIIGNPQRPQRKTAEDYLLTLETLLEVQPQLLLCHDGPEGAIQGQRGIFGVRELLERRPTPLVIRGHAHWHDPFCTLPGGTQVLNVDARVVLLLQRDQI